MEFSWLSICLLGLVFALSALYVLYMSAQHNLFVQLGIPGPKPLPVVGNFHQQILQGPANFQVNMYRKYADSKVYGVFDLHVPTLVVRDLDILRDICVKNFNSFVNHRTFVAPEPLDRMLTFAKDEKWKNIRTTVSPAFSTGKLRRLFHHIIHSAQNLSESLREKQENGENVELKHLFSCFSMDVLASTGFGAQIDSLKDENNEFMVRAKRVMSRGLQMILLSFFLPFIAKIINRLGTGLLKKDDIQFFSSFIDEAIERRKKEKSDGVSKRHDLLQLLIEADADEDGLDSSNDNMSQDEAHVLKTERRPLTHEDIQAQAVLFLMAGYDTVSTVLSFTLFQLAQNLECCARLQQEIDDKIGNGQPTYTTMQDMPYMDQVINEAIRLYPPGIQLDRVCAEDITIRGVHIPKDMIIIIPVYSIHRDPKYWPEPDTFDPERFNPDKKHSRHPYAHFPFGQGPRNCVGMRLALLELKVALSVILRDMTPVPCDKTVVPVRLKFFLMTAEDGLWVKFVARK